MAVQRWRQFGWFEAFALPCGFSENSYNALKGKEKFSIICRKINPLGDSLAALPSWLTAGVAKGPNLVHDSAIEVGHRKGIRRDAILGRVLCYGGALCDARPDGG
ncbi:hypothetical protein [Fuscovulum ytuae]|uniref:Uncharacterized protein n=1 Tax=Fuscovulum ytuae TaxID=3042299 RepID=A0ABY8QD22_9RHOB|nr:hypothetical protein [Fuscovulum sp. YMD61]WGV18175.1 hypothetical protein QF092_07535 [Fuscovulum sp. YMD61]